MSDTIELHGERWIRESWYSHVVRKLEQERDARMDVDRELENANAELARLREIVGRLAQWSKDYPRKRIHSAITEEKCHAELYAIEDMARAAAEKARGEK